jgi:hypothetical protein
VHSYDVEVTHDGRWWMIRVPEIDQVAQARHAGEVEVMARDLIAVCTGQSIEEIAIAIADEQIVRGAFEQVLERHAGVFEALKDL